jgi:hypothetical protein
MACLGASLLLFEVLLTRIMALTLFANFAFAAIAVALLGMAVGGWLAARDEKLDATARLRRARWALLGAAVACALAVLAAASLPLVPETVQLRQGVANTFRLRQTARRRARGTSSPAPGSAPGAGRSRRSRCCRCAARSMPSAPWCWCSAPPRG